MGELIAEAERLAGAATEGPWFLYSNDRVQSVMCGHKAEVVHWAGFDSSHFPQNVVANAAFIAASRTLVPALVRALVAARAEIAAGKAAAVTEGR